MAYEARILLDSENPNGSRLTTVQLTYPRMVHAELMTHRVFSRNSASSRAIPVEKMIQRVIDDPVMPVWWGKNQRGMVANEELTGDDLDAAKTTWLLARDHAVRSARSLVEFNAHKQLVNRLLEPWMWITIICSFTEYANWRNLRTNKDAQPEIQKIACMLDDIYYGSTPQKLAWGEWHVPMPGDAAELFDESWESRGVTDMVKAATGKLARISYLTHDGDHSLSADIKLHDQLLASGHMSPFEHCAVAVQPTHCVPASNFKGGWCQYRKTIAGEAVWQPKK
jgi:thymidylate synthase ThyX